MSTVGFFGSRNLGGAGGATIGETVRRFCAAGRDIATGCAVGGDAQVLAAALRSTAPRRVHVYACYAEGGLGAWRQSNVAGVQAAAEAGADVHWLAGGPLTYGLVPRLVNRSRAMVDSVSGGRQDEHSGLVGWVTGAPPASPGSWRTARYGASMGLRVVVFCCGFDIRLLPLIGAGSWVSAGAGMWLAARLWLPA